MADWKVNFDSSVLEGNVKFREKKKWKSRWCVLRRLSPVANSLSMQLYKKSSTKLKDYQMKSSLNLENLLGLETCFLLGKESQTLAILYKWAVAILAFENRETLLEWQARISDVLGQSERYEVQLLSFPPRFEVNSSLATLHIRDWQFSLTQGLPPRILGHWNMDDLRRYGSYDEKRFCFEGGSHSLSKSGEGVFVLGTSKSSEINSKFEMAIRGRLSMPHRVRSNPMPSLVGLLTPSTRHRLSLSSKPTQSVSKPCTPLLSNNRKMGDLCLSPPCCRHFRSASQQHSRNSSISSAINHFARNSELRQSDPELLYDKPRSLNATVVNVTVEANDPPAAAAAATISHYDTPRRVLQGAGAFPPPAAAAAAAAYKVVAHDPHSTNHIPCAMMTQSEAMIPVYATVTKPKRQPSTDSECNESPPPAPEQVQVYSLAAAAAHRGHQSWSNHNSLPKCATTAAAADELIHHHHHHGPPEEPVVSIHVASTTCTAPAAAAAATAAAAFVQTITTTTNIWSCSACPKSSYHATLPLARSNSTDAVLIRLRRSASMPCRQGNRDSSDSTDSGVSVRAADSVTQPSACNCACGGQHGLSRHWSLPRPTIIVQHRDEQKIVQTSTAARTPTSCHSTGHCNGSCSSSTKKHSRQHSRDSSIGSNISHILDQADETLSVTSVGYETSV